MLLVFETCLG